MNQQRAMTDLDKDEEFQTKLRQVNDEVRRVKHSLKETQERQKELDRVNQEQHLVLLAMEERSRKLQTLIQQKTRQSSQSTTTISLITNRQTPTPNIGLPGSHETEAELELAMRAAQELVKEEEKKLKKQLVEAEKEWQTEKRGKEIEETKLKEKEQDLRICQMKIRELKRQQQMFQQAASPGKNVQ